MKRSWLLKNSLFLHSFLSWFAMKYSWPPFFLPVAVTVGSSFPNVVVGNRKEVKNLLDVLLVLFRIISQEVPARAVGRCRRPSTTDILCIVSHSSMFPAALITSCDSLLKGLNCRCLLKITLKVLVAEGGSSIFWIKFLNVDAMLIVSLLNLRTPGMLKSMFSSLIARLNSLSVLNDAMSRFSSGANCSFHCVCTWAVLLNRLPWSIVNLLNSGIFRQITSFNHARRDIRLPWSFWNTEFFRENLFHWSHGNGTFHLNNKHILRAIKFPRSITDWSWVWTGLVWRV